MPLQTTDTANSSPVWHSMHIFVKVKIFHLGKVSKLSFELELWNWPIHSADQKPEYTPLTDVHTVAKLFAFFTALTRTTKQQRTIRNTGYFITIQ